jgi:hypothetical protein
MFSRPKLPLDHVSLPTKNIVIVGLTVFIDLEMGV